jgi:hypothetical protein
MMAYDLKGAKYEEYNRRVEIYKNQLSKLSAIVVYNVAYAGYNESNIRNLQIKTENIINQDLGLLKELMDYISLHTEYNSSISLLTNKNSITFNGALSSIKNNISELVFFDFSETFPINFNIPTMLGGGANDDILGTSTPNFIQTSYLAILRALDVVIKINDISKLSASNIYDVNTAPTIQTTSLPDNLIISDINPKLNDWFYFYKDTTSPLQGELLIPTLGYQFGGSRYDPRYNNKFFKSEDCSSSISKWLNSPKIFSTYDMEVAYNITCLNYPINQCVESNSCPSVLKVLTPICNGILEQNIFPNDVFTLRTTSGGGHTGFITEIAVECFMGLAYGRDMSSIEGLGYSWFCPNNTDNTRTWFYFSPTIVNQDDEKDIIFNHDEL